MVTNQEVHIPDTLIKEGEWYYVDLENEYAGIIFQLWIRRNNVWTNVSTSQVEDEGTRLGFIFGVDILPNTLKIVISGSMEK